MRIAPSGKYLYCTTAGSETAGVFKIDPETGMLSKICILPISGKYPKDIAVFPDEKTMVVLNHESNEIRFFTVDYEKGLLYMKGRPIKIDTPNCILISKAGQPD
ncbi:MAG: lactonase family protein [Lachnospiraceae bacterium]